MSSEHGLSPEEDGPAWDRIKKRAMRSSTFKAIAALEDGPPELWEEGLLDEVVEDVIAVNRVRWFERVTWVVVLMVVGTSAYLAGWNLKPEPEAFEWECDIAYEGGVAEAVGCVEVAK